MIYRGRSYFVRACNKVPIWTPNKHDIQFQLCTVETSIEQKMFVFVWSAWHSPCKHFSKQIEKLGRFAMNLHILKSIYICDQNELFRILADGNQSFS